MVEIIPIASRLVISLGSKAKGELECGLSSVLWQRGTADANLKIYPEEGNCHGPRM